MSPAAIRVSIDLTADERSALCRVLGRLVHTSHASDWAEAIVRRELAAAVAAERRAEISHMGIAVARGEVVVRPAGLGRPSASSGPRVARRAAGSSPARGPLGSKPKETSDED